MHRYIKHRDAIVAFEQLAVLWPVLHVWHPTLQASSKGLASGVGALNTTLALIRFTGVELMIKNTINHVWEQGIVHHLQQQPPHISDHTINTVSQNPQPTTGTLSLSSAIAHYDVCGYCQGVPSTAVCCPWPGGCGIVLGHGGVWVAAVDGVACYPGAVVCMGEHDATDVFVSSGRGSTTNK